MSALSLYIEKVTSADVRITSISQSLPHKMAENSWYEEITSLSTYVYNLQYRHFYTPMLLNITMYNIKH